MSSRRGACAALVASVALTAACGAEPPERVPAPTWTWHPRLQGYGLAGVDIAGNGDVFLSLTGADASAVRRWDAASQSWDDVVDLPTTSIARIAADDVGNAMVAWGNANGSVQYLNFAAAVAGWSTPQTPVPPGNGLAEMVDVVMDGDGCAAIYWTLRSNLEPRDVTHHVAALDPSAGWSELFFPSSARLALFCASDVLRLAVAYTDGVSLRANVLTFDRVSGVPSWQGESRLYDGPAFDVAVDGLSIDRSHAPHVLFRAADAESTRLLVTRIGSAGLVAPVELMQRSALAGERDVPASLAGGEDGGTWVTWGGSCEFDCSLPVWRFSPSGWQTPFDLLANTDLFRTREARVVAAGQQAMVLMDQVTAWFDGVEWEAPREFVMRVPPPEVPELAIAQAGGVMAWTETDDVGMSVVVGTYRAD